MKPQPSNAPADHGEAKLWKALEAVEDPEVPVNVVDLGLIYGLEQAGGTVHVRMTFTAMGCPCTEFIIDDVRDCLLKLPGVERVNVEIVWDPPWTRDRLSPKAVEALKSWGIVALSEGG